MKYEGNPKHKEPWQQGRRGSICPVEIDHNLAQRLLLGSEAVGDKRFAVHDGKAYCAHCHGVDRWHGFPVGWVEVPLTVRNKWLKSGLISRRDIKTYWD
jgi:hypothetical protein